MTDIEEMFFYETLHMDVPVLADQLVQTQDEV